TRCDADETLAAVMDGELPSADRFEDVVGGTVDAVALRFPDRTIRAFGEMVDILTRRGLQAAAIELEELWNRLLRTRRIALLCAQAVLMWLSGHEPSTAERVLHGARLRYARAA